ncbi:MAG: methionine ABC transporter ATP-binding protein [Gammaproteobacteria bacterium]
MIRFVNISKTYHIANKAIEALQNVSLEIPQGKIFGIVGKSGAGKSTLLRTINLLEHPTSGEIYLKDQSLTKCSEKDLRQIRRKIGMIFQHFNLLQSQTVFNNIALPLQLLKTPENKIKKRVEELLQLVGLTDKMHAYPKQLSGGQKQRVAIARALATQPEILLCDEATSALDPETTTAILDLLQTINQKFGITIVLITHQLEVVKQICDEVALIHHGKLIEHANIHDFFVHPKSEIAKTLVKSCLKEELPAYYQQKVKAEKFQDSFPLIKIYFQGGAAGKPLISHLIQKLNFEINILQANLEIIHHETVGIMLIEAMVDDEGLNTILDYLTKHQIIAEVIGYVSRTLA